MKDGIRFRIGPRFLAVGLAAALMAYLTVIPLVMLIYGSLKSRLPLL